MQTAQPHTSRRTRRLLPVTSLLLALAVLVGCNEEGGPGEIPLDEDNVDDAAVAAAEVASRGASAADAINDLEGSALPFPATAGDGSSGPLRSEMAAARLASAFPAAAADDICDSGSSGVAGELITFASCTVADCTFNGSVRFSGNESSFALDFIDFTASCFGEPTVSLTGDRFACTGLGTEAFSCGYTIGGFTGGISGRAYTVSDFSFTGDAMSGYDLAARVRGLPGGAFFLETLSSLDFDDCSAGVPSAGTLRIDGAPPAYAEITFEGCDGFEACLYEDEMDVTPVCEDSLWADYFTVSAPD